MLLVSLLAYVLVGPFVHAGPIGKILVAVVASVLFLTAALLVPKTRGGLLTYGILLLLSFVGNWLGTLTKTSDLVIVFNDLFTSTFLLTTLFLILRWVLEQNRITMDEIAAGVSVYLLIALVWSHFYHALETLDPGSFLQLGEPVDLLSRHDFNYFSFVTLTTLGYGDLTPAKPFAKSLTMFEAIVGVFYLAVLISRLVSQYGTVSTAANSEDK